MRCCCNAAALALFGWCLITPPTLDPATSNTSVLIDPSAPLFKWDTLATYSSLFKCNLARSNRLARMVRAAEEEKREADALAHEAFAMTRQQTHDLREADDVYFRALLALYREQMVQREVMSKCVLNREHEIAGPATR